MQLPANRPPRALSVRVQTAFRPSADVDAIVPSC